MTIRRASLILPCSKLEDFPTHLTGREAAELLAASTALWHPALIATIGRLPGWHSADDPPDPSSLEGELVLLPTASRQRLAGDWPERVRAASSQNPLLIDALASRAEMLAAALDAAGVDAKRIPADTVADFLALGHAHLQVELLTRAMRYSSVLDTERFAEATLAAAHAAVANDQELEQAEIVRAFDLLATARNHVYAVDFYVVDVTLLAASTLGGALRTKLSSASPTSVLLTGELLEHMADECPATLAELRRAIEAEDVCPVGGMFRNAPPMFASPESLLAELACGQQAARRHMGRDFEVYGQFASEFPRRLPEALRGMGFLGALYAAFDGGRLPKADQCKTWWGPGEGAGVQAVATTPLDVSRAETWLRLAERIGDTIAHDHVATILLAGWPGSACEYYDDLRRAARYGPVLGKLVTLDEYLRTTREPDEWTNFYPRESASAAGTYGGPNPIASRVDAYRQDAIEVYDRLAKSVAAIAGLTVSDGEPTTAGNCIAVNPWNFARPQYLGADLLDFSDSRAAAEPRLLADVPGCGYAALTAAAAPKAVPLADVRTLRNERFELTVSETTGGIQSLRTHRDRGTRLSQRLVFHDTGDAEQTQMVAEQIEISRNDHLIGEITSRGRLLDRAGAVLARFEQTVRVARAAPAVIVNVEIDPARPPSGDVWASYFASRIAWSDDAISFRRGIEWIAAETNRTQLESPEWVEIREGVGTLTCFGLGLPFHRRVGPTRLDTLLLVAGENERCFQFALAIDEPYPAQTALGLLTAGRTPTAELPEPPNSPTGWFLYLGAKNVLITHVEALAAPQSGIRLRVLETEGLDTRSSLAAYRSFHAARITDFRGQPTGVLSVADGRAQFDIGPHRWIQLEADW